MTYPKGATHIEILSGLPCKAGFATNIAYDGHMSRYRCVFRFEDNHWYQISIAPGRLGDGNLYRPINNMQEEECSDQAASDPVNHPDHYQSDNGIECIDAIRAALGYEGFLAYCRGNAIKYNWRGDKKHKNMQEDMKKAAWYDQRAAEEVEKHEKKNSINVTA